MNPGGTSIALPALVGGSGFYAARRARRYYKHQLKPERMRKRIEALIAESGRFRVVPCLGVGRGGATFEVAGPGADAFGGRVAMKVHYFAKQGGLGGVLPRLGEIVDALAENGIADSPMLPRIHELGGRFEAHQALLRNERELGAIRIGDGELPSLHQIVTPKAPHAPDRSEPNREGTA